jgi:hypothetical protein
MNQFFGIYFMLKKDWKINIRKDMDKFIKDLGFNKFAIYFSKEKST